MTSTTAVVVADAALRRERALELRIAGKSFAQIAEALGCSRKTAHKLVTKALDASAQRSRESADQLRMLDLRRTESLIHTLWDRAHGNLEHEPKKALGGGESMMLEPDFDPQDKAIAGLVKLMDRRAKLMGLDTPTVQRLEHTGADGAPLGLPPQLATLAPPATHDEVLHFCEVAVDACTLESCRPHGKSAPAPTP